MRINEIVQENRDLGSKIIRQKGTERFEVKTDPKGFLLRVGTIEPGLADEYKRIRADFAHLRSQRKSGEPRQSAEERVMELAKEAGVDIRQPQIQRFAQLMIRELQSHGAKE